MCYDRGTLLSRVAMVSCLAFTLLNAATLVAQDPHPATRGADVGSPVTASTDTGYTYFAYQVDKEAALTPHSVAPSYPTALIGIKTTGEVDAMFVVDSAGLYVPNTLRIVRSTDVLFSAAVHDALPHMLFTPAEQGGHKVKQLVMHPFKFTAPS